MRMSIALLVAVVLACAKSDGGGARVAERPGTDQRASAERPVTPDERAATAQDARVVVNGAPLSAELVQQLQQAYATTIAPGRYWYDVVSGAYGRDGEPIAGQMMAGLALGGSLRADASRGTSGVFINGRQITAGEVAYIERLCQTPVAVGRYWIMASGVGGIEGGPALFNLAQCPGAQQNNGPRSSSRTSCDANGACTTTGILGSILTAPN